jgi:hypothetical protein
VVTKGMRFDGDHFEVRLLSSDAARAVTVSEGDVPLWQYFSNLQRKRQTSPSLPPKGTAPGPCGFSPVNHLFSGYRRKGP